MDAPRIRRLIRNYEMQRKDNLLSKNDIYERRMFFPNLVGVEYEFDDSTKEIIERALQGDMYTNEEKTEMLKRAIRPSAIKRRSNYEWVTMLIDSGADPEEVIDMVRWNHTAYKDLLNKKIIENKKRRKFAMMLGMQRRGLPMEMSRDVMLHFR